MKKSKFLKRASALALAALMTTGVALTVAACGGDGGGSGDINLADDGYMNGTPGDSAEGVLRVSLFCNKADTATNQKICDDWMDKYNEQHNTDYKVELNVTTDKEQYFTTLEQNWSDGTEGHVTDIFYLAPRYLRSYAETGRVLDLSQYLGNVSANPKISGDQAKALNQESFGQIWKNSLSYYSYIRGRASGDNAYTLGQAVSYSANDNKFYTDNGHEEVGLYGLPKDYSSFSTGYNKNFFTEEMKEALTTTAPNATRTVKGATGEGTGDAEKASKRTYDANSGLLEWGGTKGVVQYAVDGEYTNPYTGDKQTAKKGEIAPIINIGVPTTYYPFNFFRFNTYYDALKGKDPVAMLCNEYTNGQGYTVTIPGFPNDNLSMTKTDGALYDTSIGHVVYTYAEYSALIWAMTYYLNTFDWQPVVGGTADGFGGAPIKSGTTTQHRVIYGGEQYEGKAGAPGSVLYLLPWLFGNDADLIDGTSQFCTSLKDGYAVETEDMKKLNIEKPEDWRNYAGDDDYTVQKMNLDGTTRNTKIQYGYNSERFIETYGAFLALASDWNANDTGDTDAEVNNNGWSWFRAGRCLFYGAGSWDAATRNDSDPTELTFGQMPTPISEDYALYSNIKGANYEMVTYSNGATSKGTGDGANNDKAQRANLADGLQIYDSDEIVANQTLRQDKWGARMDSVGYAVNGQVAHYKGTNQEWKIEAAVSLVMALTIDRDAQATLTYSGAQFPNFMDQMQEFVDYQKYGKDGAFADMLTPEGFSDMKYYDDDGTVNETVAAEAKTLWDAYYNVARDMADAAIKAYAAGGDKTQTVKDFLSQSKYQTVGGKALRYNTDYDNTTLATFTGEGDARLAFSMRVLNMVALSRPDREINLRMQYGLNAVRDSTMYTYSDSWIGYIDARGVTSMFAYRQQKPLDNVTLIKNAVQFNPAGDPKGFMTPAVFCFTNAKYAASDLMTIVSNERSNLKKYQKS